MIEKFARPAKWFALIGGFVIGLIGAIWSFAFVDRGDEELRKLNEQKAAITREIESLNGIASNYFVANQQGDLIFMLSLQNTARRDLAALLLKGNFLDRATPVRNMIGALAMEGQLDFRKTYDAYAQLNDTARADTSSYDNFTRVKQREKEIIELGQNRVPVLLQWRTGLDTRLAELEASRRTSRLLGLAASQFGAFLLLLANLIEKRKPAAAREAFELDT